MNKENIKNNIFEGFWQSFYVPCEHNAEQACDECGDRRAKENCKLVSDSDPKWVK